MRGDEIINKQIYWFKYKVRYEVNIFLIQTKTSIIPKEIITSVQILNRMKIEINKINFIASYKELNWERNKSFE